MEESSSGLSNDASELLNMPFRTGYATSAAFGDYDNDGRLDLYVCYYCPWTPKTDKNCVDSQKRTEYCAPEIYPLDTHVLYHNEGGRFVDVSGKPRIGTVRAGSSYLSVSDRRVYFGLGETDKINRIDVFRPSGIHDMLKAVPADRSYIVTEGKDITGTLLRAGVPGKQRY